MSHARRIIHIEDEEVYAKLLSAYAQATQANFEVVHESSGAAGIQRLREDPDNTLVLLDMRMPEMDGPQVLQALRADRRTHDVPVIILTGDEDTASMQRADKLGATSFLPKPMTGDGFGALFRTLDSMWPYLVSNKSDG